jgi:branched-chain amino acid transport system permease protein
MNRAKWLWGLAAGSVLLLIIAPAALEPYPYIMHIAIVAFFYAILASSWSLLAGYAGQFSFAHMAFMAVGAYSTGLFGQYVRLTTAPTGTCPEIPLGSTVLVFVNLIGDSCLELGKANMPVGTLIYRLPALPGIVLGIIMGGIFGFLIGVLVLRLRRTYLALFTIGFSEIARTTLNAEIDITNGPNGLELAPLFPKGVHLFGFYFNAANKIPPYYVMLAFFLISMGLMYWLSISRFGLFIRSIREDEEAAAALGVHVVRYKVLVFVVTSMIAAGAGAVEAHYITVVTPNILLILQMSLVISMAVIGGLESLVGAAIGAIIIEFALEFLRASFTIGPIMVDMTTWRLVFFGLLLMLTLRFWNNGLIYPIIERLTHTGVAAETVSKRLAPIEEAAVGEALEGQG